MQGCARKMQIPKKTECLPPTEDLRAPFSAINWPNIVISTEKMIEQMSLR